MKIALKMALFVVFWLFRVHIFFRKRQHNKLTILLYHGVAKPFSSGIFNYRKKFIVTEVFEKQVEYLNKHYNVIDLDEAISLINENKELPPYSLAITFDDGYRNGYTDALPILAKQNTPATMFVTSNFVDKQEPLWVDRLEYAIGNAKQFSQMGRKEKERYEDNKRQELKKMNDDDRKQELSKIELESEIALTSFDSKDTEMYSPLSWNEMQQMHENGFKIGAHTKSHPILSHLPLEEAQAEIKDSFDMLQQNIKNPSRVFAYPNGQDGDFNNDIKKIVKELGFTAALTTLPGINSNSADKYELKRFSMDGSDQFLVFLMRVSGVELYLKRLLQGSY